MIALSNSSARTIIPQQSITFDDDIIRTGSSAEGHYRNASEVKLRIPGIYEVHFTGNIMTQPECFAHLAITANGDAITGTDMIASPNIITNIHADMIVRNTADDPKIIAITNIGSGTVVVKDGSGLWIRRVA